MNHLLYNISVFMLLVGIIMLTRYLSKIDQNNTCNIESPKDKNNTYEDSFTMRPSQIFDTMFTKPDVWQGYETL